MAVSRNTAQFQLDQISGSLALAGAALTQQATSALNDVLAGRVAPNEAKQAMIARYKRRN